MSRSQRATVARDFIREKLGGKCFKCGSSGHLQFDLIESDGGKHHSLSFPDRQNFYLKMMFAENLQLLCPVCHTRKTVAEVRARQLARKFLSQPPV